MARYESSGEPNVGCEGECVCNMPMLSRKQREVDPRKGDADSIQLDESSMS